MSQTRATTTKIPTSLPKNLVRQNPYPEYITFSEIGKTPSCVEQKFEVAFNLEKNKIFYPKLEKLELHFNSEYESLRFGAAQFCGFLDDTVAVEHHIVIPSICNLYKLPITIPSRPIFDLFKIVTDEGHHAAQALSFLTAIKKHFNLELHENNEKTPLFLRRLYEHKKKLMTDAETALFYMVIGVVTETRISKELGQFIKNNNIVSCVKENCRSHQADETIHSSQFHALGKWSWAQFNKKQKELAAELYARTTIERNVPDIGRIAFYMSQITSYSREQCDEIVNKIFTPDLIREELLIAARPTIFFLNTLGVLRHNVAKEIFAEAGINV